MSPSVPFVSIALMPFLAAWRGCTPFVIERLYSVAHRTMSSFGPVRVNSTYLLVAGRALERGYSSAGLRRRAGGTRRAGLNHTECYLLSYLRVGDSRRGRGGGCQAGQRRASGEREHGDEGEDITKHEAS